MSGLGWHDLPGVMELPSLESVSYVEVRPADNPEGVAAKAEALALGIGRRRGGDREGRAAAEARLEALAPGDAKTTAAEAAPAPGKKTRKKLRRLEREKTKGEGWFGMRAPEVTEEQRRDLEVLRMRGALDPKRFYKKNDSDVLPKYFQVGKILDFPADRYVDRVPKKERKSTLVDELLADAEFQRYNKRKYAEIMEEKSRVQRRYQPKKGKASKRKKDS